MTGRPALVPWVTATVESGELTHPDPGCLSQLSSSLETNAAFLRTPLLTALAIERQKRAA